MSLMLDVDQAGELKAAFRRGGWTNAEIKTACEGEIMNKFRDIVRGRLDVKPREYTIDLQKEVELHDGWSVVKHLAGQPTSIWLDGNSLLRLGERAVTAWQSMDQLKNIPVPGGTMRSIVEQRSAMNIHVRDFLVEHPALIPEQWCTPPDEMDHRHILFWGTIIQNINGDLHVPCFWKRGREVYSYECRIGRDIRSFEYAAILV